MRKYIKNKKALAKKKTSLHPISDAIQPIAAGLDRPNGDRTAMPIEKLSQDPTPGQKMVRFAGDTIAFSLSIRGAAGGRAFVRTNIGRGRMRLAEIIAAVDQKRPLAAADWHDIAMQPAGDGSFRISLPLLEVGRFKAKTFYLPDDSDDPLWVPGPNVILKVQPAGTCCANIIYNAFVRQFGPNIAGGFFEAQNSAAIDALDKSGYAVIPPSGTFRDLSQRLDFIVGKLGCRLIQLLPIHPTPTMYGRMGRFGSPYAALSFTAVDPALAVFDPAATPLEQFLELVDAIHARSAKIILDIAVNHTGWAASLHGSRPSWLMRDDSGAIESPGAWGVCWADLTRLDWHQQELWQYMAEVFLVWCARGVDGFRCDAGYMIPEAAWTYMIAKVRESFPDTIFLLEGLGGPIATMGNLLNRADFNWAYSELFQNYDRGQIEGYLPQALKTAGQDGILVHYAETHDNPRLAAHSHGYARMRTALSALFSHQGAFGFANGVEWLAYEKIDVHGAPSLNWDAAQNQVEAIARLSRLLKNHPAFHDNTRLRLIQQEAGNFVVLLRHHEKSGQKLIVAVNLDTENGLAAAWPAAEAGFNGSRFWDLLTGRAVTVSSDGPLVHLALDPAQVVCLTQDEGDLHLINMDTAQNRPPQRALLQQARVWALALFTAHHGTEDLSEAGFDPEQAAYDLLSDPESFGRNLGPAEDRPIVWRWPRDLKRRVMVPPGRSLLVMAVTGFRLRLLEGEKTIACETALPAADGNWFVLLPPRSVPPNSRTARLELTLLNAAGPAVENSVNQGRVHASLLFLSPAEKASAPGSFGRRHIRKKKLVFLATNGCGAMVHTPLAWGRLYSRYDALLAANPHPRVPVDRRIMLTRIRGWIVFQDFSQALDNDCLQHFTRDSQNRGIWLFRVPTGQGRHLHLQIALEMTAQSNRIRLAFRRRPAGDYDLHLSDARPARLILRPDIESRSFHDTTKAYLGPEQAFPAAVRPVADGFDFNPDDTSTLRLRCSQADFVAEPEWHYQVKRPLENERGLDDLSDLFSPGYFTVDIAGGGQAVLSADFNPGSAPDPLPATTGDSGETTSEEDLETVLQRALNDFVVKRDKLKSVIAGYPWFLDWGRDALIFARGLIAVGRLDAAEAVIEQFARFEFQGTLPNMIQGDNQANRDTSDAPLWLVIACRDMAQAVGHEGFLEKDHGGRTLKTIINSILESYCGGTPNGIRLDKRSGLIYSPAHYTWMDTDHPAGTPRQGYPIEIQALWLAALEFATQIDSGGNRDRWRALAAKVGQSIKKLFYRPDDGYLADCLHADRFKPAAEAETDDALRPNQLLAVTLGAVTDERLKRDIVDASRRLLVPGAIRSLADAPLKRPLAIHLEGQLLNEPYHPYQGTYQGEEDRKRKPAYHNGTAWVWLFPSFCEAYALAYGPAAHASARAYLGSCTTLLEDGVVGHLPEIVDGDAPHTPRGCDAQAWSASEFLRVWLKLK